MRKRNSYQSGISLFNLKVKEVHQSKYPRSNGFRRSDGNMYGVRQRYITPFMDCNTSTAEPTEHALKGTPGIRSAPSTRLFVYRTLEEVSMLFSQNTPLQSDL